MIRSPFWKRLLPRRFSAPADPIDAAFAQLRTRLADRICRARVSVPHSRRPEADPDAIDLAHDYPHLDVSLGPIRTTREVAALDPAGLPELRQIVADQLQSTHRRPFDPETQVRILPGGSAPLARFLDLFLNPGEAVVAFDPDLARFAPSVLARGGVVHWVSTRIEDGRIHFDVETLIRAAREARIVLLSHPNAPSGASFAAEDIEQLLFWAEKFDLQIFLDDSLGEIHAGSNAANLVDLPRAAGRVTVGGCLGEALGVPSLDVGWIAGSASVVTLAGVAQDLAGGSVSPILQRLAVHALHSLPDASALLQEELDERREYVLDRLRLCGLNPLAGGGFFALAELPDDLDSETLVRKLWLSKRVRIAAGTAFGPTGRETIRINFGGEARQLREGLARLLEVMHELLHAERVGEIRPPTDADCPEPVDSGTMESVQ